MNAQLQVINDHGIAEYSPVEAGLADLRRKYLGVVFDVSTGKGMDTAKKARLEIREPRYEVEKIRKNLKAPALEYAKRIDTEAARITAELIALEHPIDAVIGAEEKRKEAEKAERIRIEKARIDGIQAKITAIKEAPLKAIGMPSRGVITEIYHIEYPEISDDYQEFLSQAEAARKEALISLREILAIAQENEFAQAKIQAEREELVRLRAEQAERERVEQAAKRETERVEKAARDEEHAKQQALLKAIIDERSKLESAMQQASVAPVVPVAPDVPAAAVKPVVAKFRPSYDEIVEVLASHYEVERSEVIVWLHESVFFRKSL